MVATRRKQPARKKVIEVDDGAETGGGDQDEAFDIGKEQADHIAEDDEFIEGVDDHEIPILKKKSKKVRAINNKVPIKRSRIAGRLSRVQELSIEVLFEIVSNLDPIDLIRLSRTNHWFRNVLLNKSSGYPLWECAIQNLSHPPPEHPEDVSLPAWMALFFDKNCSSCGSKVVHKADIWLRVRLCPGCAKQHIVRTNDSCGKEASFAAKRRLAMKMTQTSLSGLYRNHNYTHLGGRQRFYQSVMDKRAYLKNWDMLDDYDCDTLLEVERAKNLADSSSMNSYYLNYGGGGASKIELEYQKTWLEEHEDVKKIVDMRLALKTDAETNEDGHYKKCLHWVEDEKSNKAENKQEIMLGRKQAIKVKLREEYGDEIVDALPQDLYEHTAFKQDRALTDAIWKRQAPILHTHIAFLRKRTQTEASYAHFSQKLWPDFRATKLVQDAVDVNPADVVDFPAFRAIFDAEIEETPTDEDWTSAMETLPEAIEKFRASVRSQVTSLIPKKIANIKGKVDVLQRVTTVFKYEISAEETAAATVRGRGRWDALTRHSQLNKSACPFSELVKHASMRNPPNVPECRPLGDAVKWQGVDQFIFDTPNHEFLVKLLKKGNLDHEDTTKQQLDDIGNRWLQDNGPQNKLLRPFGMLRHGVDQYNVNLDKISLVTAEEVEKIREDQEKARADMMNIHYPGGMFDPFGYDSDDYMGGMMDFL